MFINVLLNEVFVEINIRKVHLGGSNLQSLDGFEFRIILVDAACMQGLDFVIFEARKYGIRMILSLVNNFKDYGGRAAYVRWAEAAGVQVQNEDDFYTNQLIRTYYKNHVQVIIKSIPN